MTPADFLHDILDPGLRWCATHGGPPVSDAARRFLLAVAVQESGLEHRAQQDDGPARGFWQFETGGVRGVLISRMTSRAVLNCCDAAVIEPTSDAIHRAIEGHDLMAVAMARLLLYTDPPPIPTDETPAWDCYDRLWRPGKPRPGDWHLSWLSACGAVP
jgi:hypothetical protein